jgi:iron-sulfur cluster assembly protein
MLKKDSPKIPPFSITDAAVAEVQYILKEKNIPSGYGLRVGIKGGGGCGGATFVLGFDLSKEGDDVFEISGIPVFMEKKHAIFIAGKTIDFENGAKAKGFVFV